MTPQEKCVSRTTAERLKTAGFPQDTEMFFCSDIGDLTYSKNCEPYVKRQCGDHTAAPDAQEIGELIPKPQTWGYVISGKFNAGWMVTLKQSKDYELFNTQHPNEAEARATFWLYLKENNLI